MFKTIKKEIETSVTEKKSKFICHIYHVESVEEAEEKLDEVRKKYHDARHNCYAYRVVEDGKIIQKYSDDGEPSGTAGAPMMMILEKNEICNVLIIVTRYFGGILLGTGGLVKAYSEATIKALENTTYIYKEMGLEMQITLKYSELAAFRYYCMKNNILIKNEQYLENINLIIEISEKNREKLINKKEQLNFNIEKSNILSKKLIQKIR